MLIKLINFCQTISFQSWGAFLTNWTYILLTLYFTYYAVLTIIVYLARWRSPRNLFRRQQSSEHWQLFSEMSANGYEEVPSDGEVSAVTTYTRLPFFFQIQLLCLHNKYKYTFLEHTELYLSLNVCPGKYKYVIMIV